MQKFLALFGAAVLVVLLFLPGPGDFVLERICTYFRVDPVRCDALPSDSPQPPTPPPSLTTSLTTSPPLSQGGSVPQVPEPSAPPPTVGTASPSPTWQKLKTITIKGTSNTGVTWALPQTGTYEFRYESGAYSTSSPYQPPWLTAVKAFRGTRVPWNGSDIGDPDMNMFDHKYFATQADAEGAAQEDWFGTDATAGDVYTFAAVDKQDAYRDNKGSVTFGVWHLTP